MNSTASNGYEGRPDAGYQAPPETAGAGVQRLIAIFRRRLRLFGGVVIGVIAISVVVIMAQTPQFTATATVSMNAHKQSIVQASPTQDQSPDSTGVDTEVEILKSRTLAQHVVQDLKLDHDPEFNGRLRKPGPAQLLRNAITGLTPQDAAGAAAPRPSDMDSVIDAVSGGLKVARSGQTYLINVSYTSVDPAKAALIANAFTRAYLNSQLDSKFTSTSDANNWLNERLGQLRAQVEAADTELQKYKIANNLMSSQGATLTEQEISTLDQQLAMTRAQEAEASARLSTARHQLEKGSTGEDEGEALSSPVIQQLRQQRALTSKTVADLQGRYGDRHPEMLKAKRELADIDSQIQSEIQRIISNLEAQAQVAKQRTASIESSVGQSRGKLAGNNRALVRLNELQRNADAARTLYETLLNRYKETSVEKGLQQTDAHVVSPANVPTAPSSRKGLMGAFAILLALSLGCTAVVLAELLDNGISDGDMIEREMDAAYLGSIPLLSSATDTAEISKIGPERFVVERPLSSFAEAIRSLTASVMFARIGDDVKVIAVTSSLPGEGKTTSSICLARSLALSGKKVVIVDCDLRQRALKRMLTADVSEGILELLNGNVKLDDVLVRDTLSSAMVLPVSEAAFTPRDVFGTNAMRELVSELRSRFDIVILDTAPVLLVTETRTVVGLADAMLLLVRWRKTSRRAVAASLKLLRAAKAPLAGTALTQVNIMEAVNITSTDPSAYYKSYKQYYSD